MIQIDKIFSVSDSVKLYNKEETGNQHVYSSVVLNVKSNKLYLDAAVLINDDPPFKTSINDVYTIRLRTKANDNYTCDLKVSGFASIKKRPVIIFEPILEIIPQDQRRDYYRLDCTMPMKYTVVSSKIAPTDTSKSHNGIVKDIGGGGMRCITNIKLVEGDTIQCVIVLNKQYLVAAARVVACTVIENSKSKYQVRLCFTSIEDNDKDTIIQYIFDAHRKMLMKSSVKNTTQ